MTSVPHIERIAADLAPPRLSPKLVAPISGYVDGGWWPHPRDRGAPALALAVAIPDGPGPPAHVGTRQMTLMGVGVLAAFGAVVWAVTPIVSMARRGTLDQQALAAMRDHRERAETARRAMEREGLIGVPDDTIVPASREPADGPHRNKTIV